ncbi:hypothetical protein [Azospirillum argentinense]
MRLTSYPDNHSPLPPVRSSGTHVLRFEPGLHRSRDQLPALLL